MAANTITIYTLHRAITVSPPEPAPETTPRPPNPYSDYKHRDSPAEFVVRGGEGEIKLMADVDRRVEQLRQQQVKG